MWVVVLAVLLAVAVLLLLWVRRREPFTTGEVPKSIWTYWDSEDLPDFVSKCIDKWRRLHPEWSVTVLNPTNLKDYLPETDIFKLKFADTKPRQSDFVRLYILPKYGGVWSDASVIPTRPVDWVLDEKGSDFVGYYRKGATTRPEYPVIESWFFACPKGSKFVSKLRDEMLTMNSLENEADYKEHVKARGVDLQEIPQPDYLNIYLAAQAVMQTQMTPEEIKTKIKVYPSEDGPFKHSVKNNWKPAESVKSLCELKEVPEMIKIYGLERKAMEADSELKKCTENIIG
jgi:hypothetical protein